MSHNVEVIIEIDTGANVPGGQPDLITQGDLSLRMSV
jgi:hypothetical protein